jgi:adenylate cyclase
MVGNFGGNASSITRPMATPSSTARRLEAANNISASAFASAPRSPSTEISAGVPVGDLVLRGRSEPLRAYEPLSERRSPPRQRAIFEAFAGWRPAMPRRCRPLPRGRIHADERWPAFICGAAQRRQGVRMQLE